MRRSQDPGPRSRYEDPLPIDAHAADILMLLGPLADIMPRVFGFVLSCALVVLAVDLVGRAVRRRRSLAFSMGWVLGIVASSAGFLCFVSLADYGGAAVRRTYLSADPLSVIGLTQFMKSYGMDIMLSAAVGAVIWTILIVHRPVADVSAEDVLTSRAARSEPGRDVSFRPRK